MRVYVLVALVSLSSRAETWTMTNGVPVTGTVVSSQVATVWIKSPLGVISKMPVEAFDMSSLERLPKDAADAYYRSYIWQDLAMKWKDLYNDRVSSSSSLMADSKISLVELRMKVESLTKKQHIILAELTAWREANNVENSTPDQRRAYVDDQVSKAADAILTDTK